MIDRPTATTPKPVIKGGIPKPTATGTAPDQSEAIVRRRPPAGTADSPRPRATVR